jgi:hypothetical protein
MAVNGSRIEAARRRVRIARYSIGGLAATAFALVGFAVRDAHPATQSSTTANRSSSSAAVSSDDEQESTFGFGGGGSISPAPSSAVPSVRSGGS